MSQSIVPDTEEIYTWLLSTLQHVCHIEYFLARFDLGHSDPERPHDLVGVGNKFSLSVIQGMALQYRENKSEIFDEYILPSIMLHRRQHHHRVWNKVYSLATLDDLRFGAVDAICSLLQSRDYQGGAHSYDQVLHEVVPTQGEHKQSWMREMVPKMANLEQPDVDAITSLHEFPNIGLPEVVYRSIISCTEECLLMLKGRGFDL